MSEVVKYKMRKAGIVLLAERDIYEGTDIYTVIRQDDYIGRVIFKTRITDQDKVDGTNIEGVMELYFNDELIGFNEGLAEQLRQYVIGRLESDYGFERSDVLDLHILKNGIDKYVNLSKFRVDVPVYWTDFEKIYGLIVGKLDIEHDGFVFDSIKIPFYELVVSIDHAVITMFMHGVDWHERPH